MGFVEWISGELLEIAIQILFYSGVPNALNGLKIMKEVLTKEITNE
jgi:alkylhydroperoxidase/carboxymuconolactone decarboxylase family protein YurZ